MSLNTALTHDAQLGFVELPTHLRYVGEPLTPGELHRLRYRLDGSMLGAWCVFSLLFVSILASSVWLLRVGGA